MNLELANTIKAPSSLENAATTSFEQLEKQFYLSDLI